jgi:bis(5'-nucleosyl)-tetraphosphatase (symmetrical)
VLGNHDLHLLGLAGTDGRHRKHDTLDDVLQAPDRDELLDWLRHRPMVHHEPPHLLVHAGLLPWWTPGEAVQLSAEIGQALRDGGGERLLAAHEAKEMPSWSASLEGHERRISALQAFANLRFCDREGRPRFGVKVAPQDAPDGLTPWFDFPRRQTTTQVVVCGHWAAMGLHVRDDLLAIDTGCVWGGSLTAIRLEDRAVVQEPCRDPVPRPRPG